MTGCRSRLALAGWLALAACGRSDRLVVGSKNFSESDLLAELVAQQIERRTNLSVERRLHLGGTFVCHEAITSDKIDLYIEYTGTAYTNILRHSPIADPDSVYRVVAAEYAEQFRLAWTAPFGFENTFAILVRRADAERYGLRTISDVARVAPRWRAGFGYEFLDRADGFPGLARAYGLRFAAPPAGMDLGLTYRALVEGKVDLIAGNSTDGLIAALELVALEDDRRYFPPYQAAPVVRMAALERHPMLAQALAELGGKISDDGMRRLNALADVERRDIGAIASEWLASNLP
ncbi:MAG TPA: glycine betaine ABC transporter substrate-binding protein [Gemmatimonadales bacterium]